MIVWLQYLGAFVTGSGGAAVVSALSQQRRTLRAERSDAARDDSLNRHRLIHEASEMLGELRREIERLRREVGSVRAECESRQASLKADLEIMRREVSYWQRVAGELRRDNALLRAEVDRLTHQVREMGQVCDGEMSGH